MRFRVTTISVDIPPDLPEHLINPVVSIDPAADQDTRRLQAYASFRSYTMELAGWLRGAEDVRDVQGELGTTLSDFWGVSDRLP